MNRRTTWSDFMACFSRADAEGAVDRGHYVRPPWCALGHRVDAAARPRADPFRAFVIGGSGSGKTTELLAARARLQAAGTGASVFDVCEWLADGATTADALETIVSSATGLPEAARPRVVLVDGLDRMRGAHAVDADVVERRVDDLRDAGVSVVLAVSSDPAFGDDELARRHAGGPDDVSLTRGDLAAATVRAFLRDVVRRRDADGVVTEAAMESLIDLAGGSVGRLVSATLAAGEEAYMDGSDVVGVREVEVVADGLRVFDAFQPTTSGRAEP